MIFLNAEIYSLRKKKKDSDLLKAALPDIIGELYKKDIKLLYKTELDYNYKKCSNAWNRPRRARSR